MLDCKFMDFFFNFKIKVILSIIYFELYIFKKNKIV